VSPEPNELRRIDRNLIQISENLRLEAEVLLRAAQELDGNRKKTMPLQFP
jgi:hypothetical protein